MAVTQNSFTGNGSTTTYSFTFPYLKQDEIKASLDGTATTAFTTPTATTVQFNTAPGSGVKIKIFRETNSDSLAATFYAGSAIKSEDLNDNFTQNLYAVQEVSERYLSNLGGTMTGDLNLGEDVVVKFEGASDNAHETTLTVADPTADRTITLPNVTGTVVTTGDTGTVATAMIAADAVTGAKIADDQINSEHYVDGSIDTAHIADAQITTAKILDANVTTAKILDANVTTVKIADSNVTTAKIAADAVNGTKIADDSIDSEHYVDGSIDTAHIGNSQITSAKIADATIVAADLASNAVTTAKITDANVTTAKIADSNVTTSKLVDNAVTTAKVTDANITTAKLADNAVTTAKITDANVTTVKIADSNITTAKIADDNVTTAKIPDNAITTAKIADAELTTLAGMQSGTASRLADSTALTSTTAELNILDNKSFRASGDGALTTTSDTEIPSSKVVAAHVAAQIGTVGGFTTIATEVAFPATASQPASGVIISISDAAGIVVNGSGVSTTGRTTDSTPATVTINSFPSSLNNETIASGVGMLVTSTGSGNTYTYHKILAAEGDVKQLSDDINDFNARYRIAGSAPGSNNDAGDLYFDTAANKMKVYNGTTSAWDDVASVGNFFINTISSSSNTGGGSATFNGSAYRFTLSNPPTMAQQLIVSVNGVLQKPDAGTGQPSEGFAISGNDIIFSAAPASGSDYFIVTQGSSVSIGTPSDNTVSTAKIQNLGVTNAKIANDSIAEGKLDVHNAPATGKYLKYTSNGMEWSDGASEGTDVKSTGESGTTKFLRVDGDGTCSWQVVDTDLSADTTPQLGGNLDVNTKNIIFGDSADGTTDDVLKFGAGTDLSIYSDGTKGMIETPTGQILEFKGASGNAQWSRNDSFLVTPNLNVTTQVKLNGQAGTSGQVLTSGGSGSTSWTSISAAPEVELVADGAISNNAACNITAAGKVEAVSASAAGSAFVVSGQDAGYKAFTWDEEHKLLCCWFNDASDDALKLRVGTPTGTGTSQTITWGSAQTLYTDSQGASGGYQNYRYIGAGYHPDTKFHMICWRPSGVYSIAVKINSSGSVTTKGSPNHFTGGSGNSIGNVAMTLVPTRGSTVRMSVFYKGPSSGNAQVKYREVTIDASNGATTETGEIAIMPNGNWNQHSVWADTTNDTTLVGARYNGGGLYYGLAYNGGDTQTQVTSSTSDMRPAICHDPVSDKVVFFYLDQSDGGNNLDLRYKIGTYNSAHTSVSWGSELTAINNNVHYDGWNGDMNNYVTYDSLNKKFYLAYKQSNPQKAMLMPFTIHSGGTSIVTETAIELKDEGWRGLTPYADKTTGNVYVGMARTSGDSSGEGEGEPAGATYYAASTSVTTENFLGWSAAAASDGATAKIKVTGNTVTGLSGLTPGKKYYVQSDGSVGLTPILEKTVEAGVALTSSSLLIR